MELFKTDGWNIPTTEIKAGGVGSDRKLKNKNKQKKNNKRKSAFEEEELATNGKEQAAEEVKEAQVEEPVKKKTKKGKNERNKEKKLAAESLANTTETAAVTTETEFKPVTAKLTPLQQKMMQKLSGSRFRWINEQLYTIKSQEALQLITKQPELFDEYHEGFKSQVLSWPENPVDVFVSQVKDRLKRNINAPGGLPGHKDRSVVIADMGCGEAMFSLNVGKYVNTLKGKKRVDLTVKSFDLKKGNERITVADIKNVPMEDESCNVVIFCLALMGTNFLDFIKEAYRILAPNGELWIAEIKSRFSEKEGTGEEFINALKLSGFLHKTTDSDNKMFTRFEFFKPSKEVIQEKKAKLERKQKFIERENDIEALENKRQKVPEGKWLLKPFPKLPSTFRIFESSQSFNTNDIDITPILNIFRDFITFVLEIETFNMTEQFDTSGPFVWFELPFLTGCHHSNDTVPMFGTCEHAC
ncbi:hypothetical protein WICPIJ_003986 [Wickerhamomyces pijperi]|uniref:Ribosomal RNA-processing protein 8 n=1 Tax=Wickerhamomyces pijperi TaxID=599730 RepID=A0A9P8Q8Y4_WICPI|nr:hypothetical protein WICPIJ_003986 [Wickerhamomyces pijperi]